MDELINSNSSAATAVPPLEQDSASGEASQSPGPVLPVVDFGEAALADQVRCSGNQCAAGHIWSPVLALAKCPGCSEQILVVKMVNCPICNEPPMLMRLRTDHLPQGGALMPMCKDSASLADVGMIEIIRQHAKHEEESHEVREMISKI